MNITTSSFDLSNARTCAAWSALAYGTGPASQNIRTFLTAPDTDTRVLVVEQDDGSVVIAFRGTADLRNWLTDADFFRALLLEQLNGDRCEVHAGFLRAYESIIGPLTAHLRRLVAGLRPLFITGHSLGGALALLAALELKRQGFTIAQVYTFGQPRVGNAAFKRLYEKSLGDRTYRVVYHEDIVARLPHLPAWHDPYRHAAGEVFLTAFGGVETDPTLGQLLASDLWGLYRAFCVNKYTGELDPLIDHHINNYMERLNAGS